MDTLSDSLDDLIGGERTERPAPPPAYAEVAARYTEPCAKCRGTGRFIGRNGRALGACFACKGAGKFTFKTSPEARAAKRDQADARKDRSETEALEAFKAAQPEIAAWIEAEYLRFGFAADMRASIIRFGSLTDGQLAACQKLVDRNKAREAARAERVQSAPAVDTAGVDRLKLAFDTAISRAKAKGRGLKMPRITIGTIVVSPAKVTSANPGALYVKMAGTYLGKIVEGRFFDGRDCTAEQKAKVLAFIADPKAAAEAYGIETGVCCICNATLTNKESIERGIGPICAENFGWS